MMVMVRNEPADQTGYHSYYCSITPTYTRIQVHNCMIATEMVISSHQMDHIRALNDNFGLPDI
jgi:hypothetical protein